MYTILLLERKYKVAIFHAKILTWKAAVAMTAPLMTPRLELTESRTRRTLTRARAIMEARNATSFTSNPAIEGLNSRP